ncbi:hypothetical protein F4779DRAFT_103723 [Xylariaceae sp. FL0662B]|nr:hypothetical protein F4779DRAFT_103723 [Xylariaceae sp. FL0662B]
MIDHRLKMVPTAIYRSTHVLPAYIPIGLSVCPSFLLRVSGDEYAYKHDFCGRPKTPVDFTVGCMYLDALILYMLAIDMLLKKARGCSGLPKNNTPYIHTYRASRCASRRCWFM